MTTKSRKHKGTKAQRQKAYRIFRFTERFELKDKDRHCRKTALLFSKRFVSDAAGQEAMWYFQQFAMLCNGDGELEAMLDGIYGRLINLASMHRREMRGYLLDVEGHPLTNIQISNVLKIKLHQMNKYLKHFQSVKLLELTELPEFDLQDEQQEEQTRSQHARSTRSKRSQPAANPQAARSQHANAIKNKSKTKIKDKAKAKEETKVKADRLGKDKRAINNRQKTKEKEKSNANALEQEKKKSEPTMPKQTDAGGSVRQIRQSAGPLGSVQKLGDVAKGIIVKLDPQANQFAEEIYAALKLPWPENHQEYNREIGCFREQFHNAQRTGLPPPRIFDIGIAKAQHVAKYNKNNRRPGAVWCNVFKKSLPSKRCKVM